MSQSVCLIARIKVKDPQRYRSEYGKPVDAQLSSFGASLLAASADSEPLEDEGAGNRTALIRFPSREAAVARHEAPDYAPFKKAQINQLNGGGNLILVPGRG